MYNLTPLNHLVLNTTNYVYIYRPGNEYPSNPLLHFWEALQGVGRQVNITQIRI